MERNIKVNLEMINHTAMANRSSVTGLSTQVNFKMDRSMERDYMCGQTSLNTMETGSLMCFMVMVNIFGQMDEGILGLGKTI